MRQWDRLVAGDFAGHVARELAVVTSARVRTRHPACPDAEAPQPFLLAYTPVARTNPFQQLLYSRAHRHGAALLPVTQREHLLRLPWLGALVVHLHWIGDVIGAAKSDEEADRRVDEFAALLGSLKARRNAHILWTAHNVLPHDTKRPEADVRARRVLLDHVDAVHAMSRTTVAELTDAFGAFEAPVFFAPHPSYDGVYPDVHDQDAARAELGIWPDRFVYVFFGSLQRYKGTDVLIQAFDEVASSSAGGGRTKPHLLIAGIPSEPTVVAELSAFASGRSDVTLDARRLTPEEVATCLRAADVAVAPYRRGLNSGVFQLARTFGLPVIASNLGAFSDQAGGDVRLVTPSDPSNLARAMLESAQPGAFVGAVETGVVSPGEASDTFFAELTSTLGLPPASVGGGSE